MTAQLKSHPDHAIITVMAHYGEAYQNLCNIQKALISLILETDDMKGAALCAREVRELEAYKRELRGQARLKAVEPVNALRNARTAPAALDVPSEIAPEPSASKESLKHASSPTVPTPPTPDAPVAE